MFYMTNCNLNLPNVLSYEVCLHWSLVFGQLYAGIASSLDTLQHPRHISCELSHGLHAFQVLPYLFRCVAMHLVPVFRRNHWHAGNGEIAVHVFEGSLCSASSTTYYGSCGLVEKQGGL